MEPHNSGQDTEARIGRDAPRCPSPPCSNSSSSDAFRRRRAPQAISLASNRQRRRPLAAGSCTGGTAEVRRSGTQHQAGDLRQIVRSWTWSLLLANVLRDAGEPRKAGIEAEALVAREPQRARIRQCPRSCVAGPATAHRRAFELSHGVRVGPAICAGLSQRSQHAAANWTACRRRIGNPVRRGHAAVEGRTWHSRWPTVDRMGRRAEAKTQYRAIHFAGAIRSARNAYNRWAAYCMPTPTSTRRSWPSSMR